MGLKFYFAKFIEKARLPIVKNSKIHRTAKLTSGVTIHHTSIKRFSYVGMNSRIVRAKIGSFCSIAGEVTIGGSSHPIRWVSSSPVFHKGKNIFKKNFSNNVFDTSLLTHIGNDVWIGSKSIIKAGVSISDGAIIGMGSVVTKNIGPYEIWAGNPAKLIRKRFDDDTIAELLKIQWWNLNDKELYELGDLFDDPEKLIDRINVK